MLKLDTNGSINYEGYTTEVTTIAMAKQGAADAQAVDLRHRSTAATCLHISHTSTDPLIPMCTYHLRVHLFCDISMHAIAMPVHRRHHQRNTPKQNLGRFLFAYEFPY